jgi:hypothetical protein
MICTLFMLCILLQSVYQPENAINKTKIHFMTSIKLLRVLTPEFDIQRGFYKKGL